jgi:23S rRNA pseudouridine1911/1915/1917 synthase
VTDPERATRSFAVEEAWAGARLDVVLVAHLGVGRAQVRALLDRGRVRLDGRRLELRHKRVCVSAGSRVEVEGFVAPDARRAAAEPERPLGVLARGSGWIVLDKPAGTPVHPLREDERGTLLHALVARHPEVHGVGEGGLRSGVVHRLDVDTSGAVLFALDAARWQRLRQAFREHRVGKLYRVLAAGRLEGEGAVEVELAVARHRPARVVVRRVLAPEEAPAPGGRRAGLRWRALAHGHGATLLEVEPRTGFLHQIRATLAWLGHPVCGDRVYGTAGAPSGAARQMLHAARLRLDEIDATSPDPPDFAATCRALASHSPRSSARGSSRKGPGVRVN